MTLEHDDRSRLAACGGRHEDDEVSSRVLANLETVAGGP
jgi:hypothetical protein